MLRTHIPSALRRLVIKRASGCCEYCLLNQDDSESSHQIDHLIAVRHGGLTVSQNLALACQLCNRYKGPNVAAIDPQSGEIVALFNPRTQNWNEHFELSDAMILGLTAAGRATVQLLLINEEARLIDRKALIDAGRYPMSVR
jgi:HNH endonuclease